KEDIDMCKAVSDFKRQCKAEGKKEGLEEGLAKGKEEGLAIGERNGLKKTIKILLELKIKWEDIKKYTQASDDLIQEIALSLGK
ncbi:MAG: hypothetical protein IJJ26_12640, partial [Victivallales bacterium]|nr:hypothetical protein [Victivallales bacterium]